MHGLFLRPTKPPWTISLPGICTQSLHELCNICPSNLQTLENSTVANITPEHHMKRNVLRMPRHDLSRPHILRKLEAFPANIVLNLQVSIGTHLTHGTRINQRLAPVDTEALPVLISAVNGLAYGTIRISQVSVRTPS